MGLTPEVEKFLKAADTRQFNARDTIMREKEPPDALYYIVKGSVTVHMEDDEGGKVILAYLGPGEFFGELGLFTQQNRSAWVRARTDCEVAILGYDQFRELYRNEPELLVQITSQIAQRLRSTSRKVGDLTFLDVTGRVARALLDLAKDSEAITHPDGMLIRITRDELGKIVSCTREMAGKVLKDLESRGLVQVDGKSIVVYTGKQ